MERGVGGFVPPPPPPSTPPLEPLMGIAVWDVRGGMHACSRTVLKATPNIAKVVKAMAFLHLFLDLD